MVTIRLQRRGKIHEPFYHIVATDSRKAMKGAFIERLGYYDPKKTPSIYVVNEDRLRYWYGKGAGLSNAVATIVKNKKITLEREQTTKSAAKS